MSPTSLLYAARPSRSCAATPLCIKDARNNPLLHEALVDWQSEAQPPCLDGNDARRHETILGDDHRALCAREHQRRHGAKLCHARSLFEDNSIKVERIEDAASGRGRGRRSGDAYNVSTLKHCNTVPLVLQASLPPDLGLGNIGDDRGHSVAAVRLAAPPLLAHASVEEGGLDVWARCLRRLSDADNVQPVRGRHSREDVRCSVAAAECQHRSHAEASHPHLEDLRRDVRPTAVRRGLDDSESATQRRRDRLALGRAEAGEAFLFRSGAHLLPQEEEGLESVTRSHVLGCQALESQACPVGGRRSHPRKHARQQDVPHCRTSARGRGRQVHECLHPLPICGEAGCPRHMPILTRLALEDAAGQAEVGPHAEEPPRGTPVEIGTAVLRVAIDCGRRREPRHLSEPCRPALRHPDSIPDLQIAPRHVLLKWHLEAQLLGRRGGVNRPQALQRVALALQRMRPCPCLRQLLEELEVQQRGKVCEVRGRRGVRELHAPQKALGARRPLQCRRTSRGRVSRGPARLALLGPGCKRRHHGGVVALRDG
mmetsp:Transcript_101268/g.285474  ORF Transcript_101268/g.285474 Transcript_101268/m.285474 type:complete len:542 (-) Transcript_101268:1226-2851(-)